MKLAMETGFSTEYAAETLIATTAKEL